VLDCRSCDDTLKKERGHDEKGIIPFFINGEITYRCPLMTVTPLSWEYIKAFSFFEKGCFPNGLAWNKESNKYLQAMILLQNEFGRKEKEKIDARHKTGRNLKAKR